AEIPNPRKAAGPGTVDGPVREAMADALRVVVTGVGAAKDVSGSVPSPNAIEYLSPAVRVTVSLMTPTVPPARGPFVMSSLATNELVVKSSKKNWKAYPPSIYAPFG